MLFAVHIADGVLQPAWWLAAWVPAALLTFLPLWRLDERSVARLGLAAALFFVASAVPIPLGIGRVHLLGTGLIGALAGWRAGLPVAVGLFLQSRLLGHGGLTSLGFNITCIGLPAVLLGLALSQLLPRLRVARRWQWALVGLLAGILGVVLPVSAAWFGLWLGAMPDVQGVSWMFAAAHVPVALIEGVITAAMLPHLVVNDGLR